MKKTIKEHYKTLLPEAVNDEINERLTKLKKQVEKGEKKIKHLKSKRKAMHLPVVFTREQILNTV